MDDFSTSGLHESKNEWGARLLTILTPHIIEGFRSILDESVKLCKDNDEMDKYLMTFQNFISRIPKWNADIISKEVDRIIEKSGCAYLEDLITCVHVIQLKILTSVRVGKKAKKIDLNIMNLNDFVHKAYINVARQVYKNVYLFDIHESSLTKQKYNRELELIVQECILNTVRDSIPVQTILRCYLDETTEEDIEEEVKEEDITPPEPEIDTESVSKTGGEKEKEGGSSEEEAIDLAKSDISNNESTEESPLNISVPTITKVAVDEPPPAPILPSLTFSDVDKAMDADKNEYDIAAPKSIERLEEISKIRNEQRKQDEDDDRISIFGDDIKLDATDIHSLDEPKVDLKPDLLMNEVEILS